MKTLDEVIFEAPYSPTPWEADALHYLKVFRDAKATLEFEKDNYRKAVDNCEKAELKYTKMVLDMNRNDPLTWDELKAMGGKPVWVQWTVKGKWNHGDWNLIHALIDDRVWFVDGNGEITDVPEELQGETWQAYRKERSDAAV